MSIVQAVGKALNLSREDLEYSLKTLYNYGNMSSGTVFFTFEDLIKNKLIRNANKVVMIAFGPGLVVEMALLEKTSND